MNLKIRLGCQTAGDSGLTTVKDSIRTPRTQNIPEMKAYKFNDTKAV